MGLEAHEHLFLTKGLSYIIDAAGIEPGDQSLGLIVGSDKEDRNSIGRIICLEAVTNFVAVHLRHAYVEKNRFGLALNG